MHELTKALLLLNERKKRPKSSSHVSLTSDEGQRLFNEATNVAAQIKKMCGPWLSQTNNGKLKAYRGESIDFNQLASVKTIRSNREPLDSSKDLHSKLNNSIADEGFVANRSNSVFVTGSVSTAEEYDNNNNIARVVLPVGEFNYTWSPDIHDATHDFSEKNLIEDSSGVVFDKFSSITDNFEYNAHYVEHKFDEDCTDSAVLNQFTAKPKYKDQMMTLINTYPPLRSWLRARMKSLSAEYPKLSAKPLTLLAIAKLDHGIRYSRTDVADMFKKCEKYLADHPELGKARAKEKLWRGDDGSLQKAINSNHEIMVKCDKAIFVRSDFYQHYILPLLTGKKLDVVKAYKAHQDHNDNY